MLFYCYKNHFWKQFCQIYHQCSFKAVVNFNDFIHCCLPNFLDLLILGKIFQLHDFHKNLTSVWWKNKLKFIMLAYWFNLQVCCGIIPVFFCFFCSFILKNGQSSISQENVIYCLSFCGHSVHNMLTVLMITKLHTVSD